MKHVEGNYVTGLTHATGVDGNAILTGDTFKRRFHRRPDRSADRQARHRPDPQPAPARHGGQFSVHVDGAMPDVMTLIDMKPLNYPTRFGIDPKTTAARPAPI